MPYKFPLSIQENANNKPTAAQAYVVGGATTGHRTFASVVADGELVLITAEEVDGDGNPSGAWETVTGSYATTPDPDEIQSRTLVASSSGSLIDWSTATGIDATPRLTYVNAPTGGRRVYASGVPASETNLTFGGATGGFISGKDYVISVAGIRFSNDAVTLVGEAYAGSWITASQYCTQVDISQGASAALSISDANANFVLFQTGITIGNDNTGGSEERFNMVVRLNDPANTASNFDIHGHYACHWTSGQRVIGRFAGMLDHLRTVTGFRLRPSAGDWGTTGRYECWEYDRGYT